MLLKEKLMIVRDGGVALLVIVAIIAVIGYGAHKITKEHDGPVEEIAEEIIESQIEDILGLPDGTINIDLTPSSDEDKK